MDERRNGHNPRFGPGIIAACGAAAVILPLPVAAVTGRQIPVTIALMSSTFIIEYGAVPVGIAGGLDPAFILFVVSCVALGVTLLLFGLCEVLENRWQWFARFLERTRARAQKSAVIAKYGMYGLVPLVMILGFYFCAPAACVLGWRRDYATALIMIGYIIASLVTILATEGVIGLIAP